MNLILTLERHGPIFSAFLRKLLSGMHAGEALVEELRSFIAGAVA